MNLIYPQAEKLSVLTHNGIEISVGGALGSEGMKMAVLGDGHFRVTLAPSRGLPACPNAFQCHVRGAANVPLTFEVDFEHEAPKALFDEYFHSVTPDFKHFQALPWKETPNGKRNELTVAPTGWDQFSLGMQFPCPLEALADFLVSLSSHPDVSITTLGSSLMGRPIWKVQIGKGIKTSEKPDWHHYVANQHPGEGNARWRMLGMMEWLCSEAPMAKALRNRSLFTFVPLLCPDGPAMGWRRVNADGVDMNRCYRVEGANPADQTHEAFLLQQDLEIEMQGKHPITSFWCMHTWPGIVEIILDGQGREIAASPNGWLDLKDAFARNSNPDRLKPLRKRDHQGIANGWNAGAKCQFGITTFLVEGGGDPPQLLPHKDAGIDIMRAINSYWK